MSPDWYVTGGVRRPHCCVTPSLAPCSLLQHLCRHSKLQTSCCSSAARHRLGCTSTCGRTFHTAADAALSSLRVQRGQNCHLSLSPGPVNERRGESLLHHQSRPFDRILALQLINLRHRAARRPVTKLKEPHKWPGPGDKPLHRITY